MIDLARLKRSFSYAIKGFDEVYAREQNIKIELLIALIVLFLAFILKLDAIKISILLLVIAQVISLEILNTAMEIYIDRIHHRDDEKIGLVKDLLAGAVFISALFAVLIGVFIFFGPTITQMAAI